MNSEVSGQDIFSSPGLLPWESFNIFLLVFFSFRYKGN